MTREEQIMTMIETQAKVLGIQDFNPDKVVRFTRVKQEVIKLKDSVATPSYSVYYLVNDDIRYQLGSINSTFNGYAYEALLFGKSKHKLQKRRWYAKNGNYGWAKIKEFETITEMANYVRNIDTLIEKI